MEGEHDPILNWHVSILVIISMFIYSSNYIACRIFFKHGGTISQFTIFRDIFALAIAYSLIERYKNRGETSINIFNHIDSLINYSLRNSTRGINDLDHTTQEHPGEHEFENSNSSLNDDSNTENSFPIIIPKDNWAIYIASIAGALRQILMPAVLKYTFARNAGIIQPSVPIVTAFISQFMGIETVSLVTYLCILISAIGLAISIDIYEADIGVPLLLFIPVAKAIQVISLKIASRKFDKSLVHIYQIIVLVASLPFLLLYQLLFGSILSLFLMNFTQVICIAYSALFVIYIAWKIQLLGVKVIGPTKVALFQAIQPCFTMILEYLIMGEHVSMRVLLGTSIVILALIIQMKLNNEILLDSANLEMRTRLLSDP